MGEYDTFDEGQVCTKDAEGTRTPVNRSPTVLSEISGRGHYLGEGKLDPDDFISKVQITFQ